MEKLKIKKLTIMFITFVAFITGCSDQFINIDQMISQNTHDNTKVLHYEFYNELLFPFYIDPFIGDDKLNIGVISISDSTPKWLKGVGSVNLTPNQGFEYLLNHFEYKKEKLYVVFGTISENKTVMIKNKSPKIISLPEGVNIWWHVDVHEISINDIQES